MSGTVLASENFQVGKIPRTAIVKQQNVVAKCDLSSQTTSVQITALPFISFVIWGELLRLSVPQIAYLYDGYDRTCTYFM